MTALIGPQEATHRFQLETKNGPQDALFRSESPVAFGGVVKAVDDRLTADAAIQRTQQGERLLYQGDFHNARQLVTAMVRRLARGRSPKTMTPLDAFIKERRLREREQETVGGILVALDANYALDLKRAPDVKEACVQVWGPSQTPWTVVPLRTLMGMMGAAEWRRRGLQVPGVQGKLHPHYGVFTPTRHEYVGLLREIPSPAGKVVFDIGTGTGVLAFVLLQKGAASVVATDAEPRSVACARENARLLGLSARMEVREQALFPEGKADLVLCNPPWIPAEPKTRLDRAIFDEGGKFLSAFLTQLPLHLKPGGEAYLFLSNFPELLGLRDEAFLDKAFADAGLKVSWKKSTKPSHPKAADSEDPLHPLRAKEVTSLYCLAPALG